MVMDSEFSMLDVEDAVYVDTLVRGREEGGKEGGREGGRGREGKGEREGERTYSKATLAVAMKIYTIIIRRAVL